MHARAQRAHAACNGAGETEPRATQAWTCKVTSMVYTCAPPACRGPATVGGHRRARRRRVGAPGRTRKGGDASDVTRESRSAVKHAAGGSPFFFIIEFTRAASNRPVAAPGVRR